MKRLAIIAVALLAGACGSSSSSSGGASDTPPGPAGAAFRFARCMRAHGASGFPDPQLTRTPGGDAVGIRQAVPASAGLSPRFQAAQKACQGILPPPGRGSGGGGGGPGKQVLLAFAHCLRSQGVSGFPDPNGQGQITPQMISAAGVDLRAPSFMTAARACVGVTHGAITMAEVAQAVRRGG
jgi:hypothetical protein